MESNKHVLVVEHSTSTLKPINESNSKNDIVLSGTFTEFDIENRNKRIYNANQFMPHLNEMMERKRMFGVVYGEFDHPNVFDTSLSRVSHVIENAVYNEKFNRIDGKIKLLNTDCGKNAQAIVEQGLPIFVSSRAAGTTDGNGNVSVKKLFTYDAVADPGFASTKMHLENNATNESINEGYTLDSLNECLSNYRIYDVTNESKFNELIMDNNNNDYVTRNQMSEYTGYLKEQINKMKIDLAVSAEKGDLPMSKINDMVKVLEGLQEQQEKTQQYMSYLGDNMKKVYTFNDNITKKTEKLVEKTDNIVKHNNYLAERIEKTANYTEYIAETLDKGINFIEYVAEHTEKTIAFTDYLSEKIKDGIEYSEYIAETLGKSVDYMEMIGEHVNETKLENEKNSLNLKSSIEYTEYVAEKLKNTIEYSNYLAEHLDNSIKYSEYISEEVSVSQAFQNYIAETLDKTIDFVKDSKVNEAIEAPNFKETDVQRYYEDENTQMQPQTQVQNPQGQVQNPQGQVQNPQGQVQNPQGQVQNPQTQVQNPQSQIDDTEVQLPQDDTISGIPSDDSVENTPVVSTAIEPGMTIDIDGKSAQILAVNKENGIATVQFNDVDDEDADFGTGSMVQEPENQIQVPQTQVQNPQSQTQVQNPQSQVQVQNPQSQVQDIDDDEFDFTGENNEYNNIKSYIGGLISETKKRKVEEENVPHFLTFLTDKKKKVYEGLSTSDKNKVKLAMADKTYFSSMDVTKIMTEALTPVKTFEEKLVSNVPDKYKTIFEGLDINVKKSYIAQAKLYPSLDTDEKMEYFWESRNLDTFHAINENKEPKLNENKSFNNDELTEEQLEMFFRLNR